MVRSLLFVLAFVKFDAGLSQADYRKGFIVVNEDTVQGWVSYRENDNLYKQCYFKATTGQKPVTYTPSDIKAYGFENDKVFRSKKITLDSMRVFVEVLVSGQVSLYKYDKNFYLEKYNNGLQRLVQQTKEDVVDGTRVLRDVKQYIGTINMLMFDCVETRARAQKVRLVEKALTNLVEDYNECRGYSSITYKRRKPWTEVTVGVVGGVNLGCVT